MVGYPIKCNVCSENITSKEDHLGHFSLHQSQITSLVQDLFRREPSEACEPRNDATDSESCCRTVGPVPQGQEEGGHRPFTNREKHSTRRTRRFLCPEGGCKSGFVKDSDLVRHRFTHYRWNRACGDCSDKFTRASTFIQHQCKGELPKRQQIDCRRELVERDLDVNITGDNLVRRGKRIKAEATSAPEGSLQFEDGAEVQGESSSNNAPLQTMQGIPSPEPVDDFVQ
ncbi:hypothetical protein B0J13DRAFT_332733 [Dactylonectria estremocensis]|uniref:C2H2-type domain-containing protein n=1 Tax=Dactylonectria estremocensis TaxID=1079267 RepID=A0A9P9CX62_9HYPO|nr:hypothetical protein B0J13DRAFT_332733 [Dactylonectria estremocensis]